MKPTSLTRTFSLGSLLAFSAVGIIPPALHAQSQDNAPSVAEAARKAREQKKAAPKQSQVITDDTLQLRPASADTGEAPPAGTVINTTPVVPSSAPPPDASAEPAKPGESPASAPGADAVPPADTDAKKAEEQAAEIAKAKQMLAQAQSELDLLKRQLALSNDTFYSNPDYAHDSDGKAKLDELQKTIGDEQISLQELKQKLEELMQEAGISPEANSTPAPPSN